MNDGRGGDDGVARGRLQPVVYEARPLPERGGVGSQHVVGTTQAQEPLLELLRLERVLRSGLLDVRLDLADGDGRDV